MSEFDALFKENFESILYSISPQLLKFDINEAEVEILSVDLVKTRVRQPDYLIKVKLEAKDPFVVQFEFQSTNDDEMHYRMAEYKAILQRKYQLAVRQFVLYTGYEELTMASKLPLDQKIEGYELISISEFDVDDLLQSETPEEIILAILGQYQEPDAREIIRTILSRLQDLQMNPTLMQKYLHHLITLSRLRKLDTLTKKEVDAMPLEFDIREDSFYVEGLEKGQELGLREGLQKGQELGKQEAIEGILRQGLLTEEQIASAMSVDVGWVLEIKRTLRG